MLPHETIARSELKFWLHPADIATIAGTIQAHLPVYRYQNGPELSDMHSVYFDSDAFSLYRSRFVDPDNHTKIRLRWYGNFGTDVTFLEAKAWRNGRRVKERLGLGPQEVTRFIAETGTGAPETTHHHAAHADTPSGMYATVRDLVTRERLGPKLAVHYARQSFQRPHDPSIRLTLDTGISMHCVSHVQEAHTPATPVYRVPVALLEVKVTAGQPAWLHTLLAHPALTETPRFSKCIHGIAALVDLEALALPRPEWAPALRTYEPSFRALPPHTGATHHVTA
jgi:SPX domain protein involved in polyphosphate accumulation